ncbi:MAG: hypothetical protein ABI316_04140 [Casimicrobiaceae bacterium]|nr:hypothetical protein [Pseudomonadota bacterium]
MKRILIGTALALFGLAPTIGSACEYNDASSASATPPTQLGMASPPPASKAPAPVVTKVPLFKQAKQAGDKAPLPAQDVKMAKVPTN